MKTLSRTALLIAAFCVGLALAPVAVEGITKTLVDTDSAQTLSNKTLTAPVLTSPTLSGTSTITGWTCSGCTLTGTITSSGTFSALTTTGQITAGSGPTTITNASGTLKASALDNSAWAQPGAIGGTTAATGRFTTVESTISTGTAPFTVASTTLVANLNVSQLLGGTWAVPGTIGSTTPNTIRGTTVSGSTAIVTPGSGTGITIDNAGELRRQIYKITIASSQFITNGTTHDLTWATVPPKTRVVGILGDVTQTFACSAVCTSSTLTMTVGKTVGGTEYLLSFDVDAAAAVFGDTDGELGASINRANAVQGGDIPSWGGSTALKLRMTSGTGNLGNGSVTNLSQGSVSLYLITEIMP
jgi:hypothetical protein